MRRVLVTGADGQLGTELQRCAWPEDIEIIAAGRTDLDLSDAAAISRTVSERPWAAVINCAAYTAVDKAESDSMAAWAVNAMAPAAFGAACARVGIPLIHVSTDYVFGGDKVGAWEVTDPVSPLGVYGASKFGGELAVRTSGARHAIVRTAWVVSAHGSNFVKTMLRLGAERETIRVVDDQRGSPTSAADLARALREIAARMVADPRAPTGTYHFTNIGEISWAGFATEIFRQSLMRGGPFARVEPISAAEYPTAARRPANSVLSQTAIQQDYYLISRPWAEALSDILDELIGEVR